MRLLLHRIHARLLNHGCLLLLLLWVDTALLCRDSLMMLLARLWLLRHHDMAGLLLWALCNGLWTAHHHMRLWCHLHAHWRLLLRLHHVTSWHHWLLLLHHARLWLTYDLMRGSLTTGHHDRRGRLHAVGHLLLLWHHARLLSRVVGLMHGLHARMWLHGHLWIPVRLLLLLL
jgi:hypothetical protein